MRVTVTRHLFGLVVYAVKRMSNWEPLITWHCYPAATMWQRPDYPWSSRTISIDLRKTTPSPPPPRPALFALPLHFKWPLFAVYRWIRSGLFAICWSALYPWLVFLLAFNPSASWTPIHCFMKSNKEAGNMETIKAIYELNPELLTAETTYGFI